MFTQERWNPEVAIIFSVAARYRRATIGSSHDGAHPDNSTLHTVSVWAPLLYIVPQGPWQFESLRNAASFFVHFVGMRFSFGG
jgi:hypothetical protein